MGPNISTNDTPLANVDSFKYLSSIISNDGNHIQHQQSKPSARIGGTEVHNHHNIGVSTKLIVHRAVVFTSLLYGCETCMSNSWSTLTCVLSIPYLASAVKTVSQTQRSWTVKIVPALSPYSSRPSCHGWEVHQDGRMARERKTARGSGTRTRSRGTFGDGASSRKNLRLQLASTCFEEELRQRLMAAYERRH